MIINKGNFDPGNYETTEIEGVTVYVMGKVDNIPVYATFITHPDQIEMCAYDVLHRSYTRPDCIIFDCSDDGYVSAYTRNYHPRRFERTRRITGYLVGTVDRWNDAKKAELNERVKHKVGGLD